MARLKKEYGTWPVATENELPPLLACGPCIENWIADDEQPDPYCTRGTWRYRSSIERWRGAVNTWATETGWANPGRTARQAQDLARVKFPWSRQFLESRGEHELIDYYEGRRAEHPGRLGPGFQPTF